MQDDRQTAQERGRSFKMRGLLLFVGRCLLASFFVLEGIDKVRRFGAWTEVVRKAGLPFPAMEMALVVGLLSVGSLSLLLNLRLRLGISCLLIFLLPTALVFESSSGMIKCFSIAGGLVLLWVTSLEEG